MKTAIILVLLVVSLRIPASGQTTETQTGNQNASALGHILAHFDVTDSTVIEALSKLSLERIAGLHLGIEEILLERFSAPRDRSVRFSLNLTNASVRDVMEKLCQLDSGYSWSIDGSVINIYPREVVSESAYLLNREIGRIALDNTTYPSDTLTPLVKLFPTEQIGYAGVGGGNPYPEPWSVVFERLTVRQLMNRTAEHFGAEAGWIWSGSKDQRFFFFFQFGFQR